LAPLLRLVNATEKGLAVTEVGGEMSVNWASLFYLVGLYWPYLAAAGVIGLVVGWRSFAPPRP
jgi:hypothetical protein